MTTTSDGSTPTPIDQIRDVLRRAHKHRGSVEDIRRREAHSGLRRRAGSPAVGETVGSVDTLRVPGEGGRGTIVLAHGGGFVSGSPELTLPVAESLARASGCDVVLPRYRLAPEHPAPAAIEDVTSVASALGPSVVLAGCSAGANIALSAALRCRPRALVLMSPWVDLRLITPSLSRAGVMDPSVTLDELQRCAESYRGALGLTDPSVSPAFADLTGLPATLIQVGAAEALHGDGVLLSTALGEAGVPHDLREWPDMIHNWQFFGDALPEAGAAVMEVATWSRNALGLCDDVPSGKIA